MDRFGDTEDYDAAYLNFLQLSFRRYSIEPKMCIFRLPLEGKYTELLDKDGEKGTELYQPAARLI